MNHISSPSLSEELNEDSSLSSEEESEVKQSFRKFKLP